MNHYRRHTESHSARTAHLSLVEEGAYNRLLDWQYSNEAPLPPTFEELHRITRATTAPERRATARIATLFFASDGWNPRAREEIEPSRARSQTATPPARSGEPLALPQITAAEGLRSLLDPQHPRQAAPEPETVPAPPPTDASPEENVDAYGFRVLSARQARPDIARMLLRLMRNRVGEQGMLELLRACDQQGIQEPIPWLQRAMAEMMTKRHSAVPA